jgi:hypothetical protein
LSWRIYIAPGHRRYPALARHGLALAGTSSPRLARNLARHAVSAPWHVTGRASARPRPDSLVLPLHAYLCIARRQPLLYAVDMLQSPRPPCHRRHHQKSAAPVLQALDDDPARSRPSSAVPSRALAPPSRRLHNAPPSLPLRRSRRRRHGRPPTGTRSTSTPYKSKHSLDEFFTPFASPLPSDHPRPLPLLN